MTGWCLGTTRMTWSIFRHIGIPEWTFTCHSRGSIPTDMCFSKWVGQNCEYSLKHDSWESKSTYSGDLKYQAPGTFDYHCLVLKILGKLQWFPVTNSLTKGPFNQMDSEGVPLCNFLGFWHHHQLEGSGSYIYLGFCQSCFKNDTISPSKWFLVGAPSSCPTALRHGFKFSSSCGHVASLGGGWMNGADWSIRKPFYNGWNWNLQNDQNGFWLGKGNEISNSRPLCFVFCFFIFVAGIYI